MNLQPGTLLQGGKYRIEKVLGHGGFGITYLATQTGLNRRVAIKEFFMAEYCNRDAETSHVSVPSEGSKELVERFRKKFVKEAQNIACLKHPHIISIHDVFEDNGTAYYVMEYLDHGSLADLVKQRGRLAEADALRYTRQIADALRYIHARKMNHLDVKPGNILVDEADGAVLIDFGLSKRYDDEGNQTSTTPVGISHGYAPLEQYKKSGVGTFSPATDIYSLGATLYKLITGTTPPDADIVIEEGLPALPSHVSSSIASAIQHAMQPLRKDRPQTVDAFLALLAAEVDESTHFDDDSYPLRPSGSSPLKRDSAALAEEDVEDKHSKKALSPFKGDERSGARHNVAEGVNNEAEPTPIWKKLLLPAVACIAVVLAVVLWPKGGDAPAKEEDRQEILPPAGRQNATGQQLVSKERGIVPSWINDVTDKRLWLGVSPPTKDKSVARDMAIQNAILYYLCANGGGALKVIYNFDMNHFSQQSGDELVAMEEKTSLYEGILLTFENFSIETLHEYYNSRGEYFVACELLQGKNTGNTIKVSRKWLENDARETQPKPWTQEGRVGLEITTCIDGKEMSSGLTITYGTNGNSYVVTSGDAVFAESHNWKYPKMQLSSIRNAYGYQLDIDQSLGVTQMVALAVSPFITETANVHEKSYMDEKGDGKTKESTFSSFSVITEEGKSMGLGTVLYGFKQRVLDIAITKYPLNNAERTIQGFGYSEHIEGRPLSLSKLGAYYHALCDVAGQMRTNIISTNETADLDIVERSLSPDFYSIVENNIPKHHVDWCLDVPNPIKGISEAVRVSVDKELIIKD